MFLNLLVGRFQPFRQGAKQSASSSYINISAGFLPAPARDACFEALWAILSRFGEACASRRKKLEGESLNCNFERDPLGSSSPTPDNAGIFCPLWDLNPQP